jgi:hypothetical protein
MSTIHEPAALACTITTAVAGGRATRRLGWIVTHDKGERVRLPQVEITSFTCEWRAGPSTSTVFRPLTDIFSLDRHFNHRQPVYMQAVDANSRPRNPKGIHVEVPLYQIDPSSRVVHEIKGYSVASSNLIFAMASAGFRPFGQVREPREGDMNEGGGKAGRGQR